MINFYFISLFFADFFSGKHHQIRRMAHRQGYHVIGLKRVCISGILSIDTVPLPGDCRWLTVQEYNTISRHLGVDPEYYSEKHKKLLRDEKDSCDLFVMRKEDDGVVI